MSKKQSTGYNPAQQKGGGSSKDQAALNAKAKEGREKAAARKKAAAGHGTPKAPQRTMGRTATLRRFIQFEPGARFMLERALTFNGNKLEEAGEVVHISEMIGEKGLKISIVGKERHHIVTVGALYKAVLPAA